MGRSMGVGIDGDGDDLYLVVDGCLWTQRGLYRIVVMYNSD